MEYLEYFGVALFFSSLLSMAGTGAAAAIIPSLGMLGVGFNLAKASGLFAGLCTSTTSTALNLKHKIIDIRFSLPIAFGMLLFSPLGAQFSRYLDINVVKGIFIIFLIFSGSMMMFAKKELNVNIEKVWIFALIGVGVGFMAGMLGLGGGNILLPVLILLGVDAKKAAVTASFTIPLSATVSFISYMTFVHIDWLLIAAVSLGAVIGGIIGNSMMYFKLSSDHIRKLVAFILYILAIKMSYDLL